MPGLTDPSLPEFPSDLGEFTVVGVLGQGGSATVFDARWGHRSVALKVVRAELGEGERGRFLEEARLLIGMAHPGVVKALTAGTLADGRTYLAMERLQGQTLAERLADGALELELAVALFVQLCDAVDAMHAAGLIHRDLKPENVMLVDSGTELHAVLLDFGIAKPMIDGEVSLTETGQVRGTPAYMAPERFFGAPASVATDVYELTVTFYAMAAGRLPWDDTADAEVRLNPARLSDVARVPPMLDEVVARALSTRAANRPSDVAALREQVRRASGLAGGGAERVTAPVEVPPTPRTTAVGNRAGRPWQEPRAAVTTGSAASGERVEVPPARAPGSPTPAARRPRWPLVAGGVGLAAAGALAAVLILGRRPADGPPAAPPTVANDPWAGGAPPETGAASAAPARPSLEPVELDAATRSQVRDQLEQSLAYHAPDAALVVAVSLAELRSTAAFTPALARAGQSVTFTQLRMLFAGTCQLDLAARGSWLSLAMLERPGATMKEYDLIFRSTWDRDELEACLAEGRPGKPHREAVAGLAGAPITSIPTGDAPMLVGWIDDHTVWMTTRTVDAAEVAARLRPRRTAPSQLDQLGSRIDRHATVWMAGTRAAVEASVDTKALAADFTVRGQLEADGLAVAMALYLPDAKAADAAHQAAEQLVGKLTDDALLRAAIPDLALERDGTVVRLRGRLPDDLLGKVGAQLAQALP
ncbi:MAG: protein kinase [Kofleriaceae bacterium]